MTETNYNVLYDWIFESMKGASKISYTPVTTRLIIIRQNFLNFCWTALKILRNVTEEFDSMGHFQHSMNSLSYCMIHYRCWIAFIWKYNSIRGSNRNLPKRWLLEIYLVQSHKVTKSRSTRCLSYRKVEFLVKPITQRLLELTFYEHLPQRPKDIKIAEGGVWRISNTS